MGKIFYCAKCNTVDSDFKMSKEEILMRTTWVNLRDGYGGAITHTVCPHCGYVLSGFIRWYKDIDEEIVSYVKNSIELYSTRDKEGGFLKEGAIDYMYNDIVKRKTELLKDRKDELALKILKQMSNI